MHGLALLRIRESTQRSLDIETSRKLGSSLWNCKCGQPQKQPKIPDVVEPTEIRQKRIQSWPDGDGRRTTRLLNSEKSQQSDDGITVRNAFWYECFLLPPQCIAEDLFRLVEHRHQPL